MREVLRGLEPYYIILRATKLAPLGSSGSAPSGAPSPLKFNAATARIGGAAFMASVATVHPTIVYPCHAFSACPGFCHMAALLPAV